MILGLHLIKNFLTKMMESSESVNESIVVDDPTTVSKVEPLFFKPVTLSNLQPIPIQMGASLNDIARILVNKKESDGIVQVFVDEMKQEGYLVISGEK